MRLTPWEEERILLFGAAELARRQREAGILLNAPEAIAVMSDAMLSAARAGKSYAEVQAAGVEAVAPDEVIDGVRELVDIVSIEVLLGDGARLVVLVDPLGRGAPTPPDGPGAIVPAPDPDGDSRAAAHLERRSIEVRNTSRRVVRVSSHFPFDRVNPRLAFDRAAARGFRLDLEAGSSLRWAPGERRRIELVRFGGDKRGGTEA
jgi:urease subunit gamma/beta